MCVDICVYGGVRCVSIAVCMAGVGVCLYLCVWRGWCVSVSLCMAGVGVCRYLCVWRG